MRPSSVSISTAPAAPALTARSTASAACGVTIAAMICPPSKASSIRTESSDRGHHLGQDAVDGVRMDECDLEPEQPAPRLLVDQLEPRSGQVAERGSDVVDDVGDVMHPRPALRDETPHRRVAAGCGEQLDSIRADEHGDRLDALLEELLAVLERPAEDVDVCDERLIEVVDRHAHVVDPAHSHAADATSPSTPDRGSSTPSIRPYATASDGVMNRSRSMSFITCSTARPQCWERISAICRVVDSISRAAISTSDGAPRNPAEPWWIISFAWGNARRFPGAPPATIIAAADIPMP